MRVWIGSLSRRVVLLRAAGLGFLGAISSCSGPFRELESYLRFPTGKAKTVSCLSLPRHSIPRWQNELTASISEKLVILLYGATTRATAVPAFKTARGLLQSSQDQLHTKSNCSRNACSPNNRELKDKHDDYFRKPKSGGTSIDNRYSRPCAEKIKDL